jgi:hypothetical protein
MKTLGAECTMIPIHALWNRREGWPEEDAVDQAGQNAPRLVQVVNRE